MCELCMTSNLPNKQAIVMIMQFCDAQITTKQASVMNSCHSVMYKQASVMIIPNKQAIVMNSCCVFIRDDHAMSSFNRFLAASAVAAIVSSESSFLMVVM